MAFALALAGIALAHLLAAASPGPSFVVVVRESVAESRRAGLFAAFGIALASLAWAALVILGLSVILQQAAWLYSVLRLLGGAYLVYLGIRLWLGAPKPLDVQTATTGAPAHGRALRSGFLTQLLNPKAAVFFGSIFAVLLAPGFPDWVKGAALTIVVVNEFLWFALVASLFSTGRARQAYGRAKIWIDRAAGTCLALLGIRLALSER